MKNSTILVIVICIIIIIVLYLSNAKEYKTLEDLQILLTEHNIQYTIKPIEKAKQLDIAREQTIVILEEKEVYVYIVDESILTSADYRISNEILGLNYVVATTNKFIFAYYDNELEKFQEKLYMIIDKIIESEK